jgi:hypothetical protein
VLFLAAEIGLVGMLVVNRLQGLERRIGQLSEPDDRIRQRLRENRPEPGKPFAWLSRPEQLNVFVPVLLVYG